MVRQFSARVAVSELGELGIKRIAVPSAGNARASHLIFRALKETNGIATEVEDREIVSSIKAFLRRGIFACPEAAATLSALEKLEDQEQ